MKTIPSILIGISSILVLASVAFIGFLLIASEHYSVWLSLIVGVVLLALSGGTLYLAVRQYKNPIKNRFLGYLLIGIGAFYILSRVFSSIMSNLSGNYGGYPIVAIFIGTYFILLGLTLKE